MKAPLPCCMGCCVAWVAVLHGLLCCMGCCVAWVAVLHGLLCCMGCCVAWVAVLHGLLCCMGSVLHGLLCCMDCCVAWVAVLHGLLCCMDCAHRFCYTFFMRTTIIASVASSAYYVSLQPLTGESLHGLSSNTEDGARLDVAADSFWGSSLNGHFSM